VKASFLLEAVESLNALLVQFQSTPVAGFVAQIPLKVAHGQVLSSEQVGSAPSSSSFSGSISVEGAEKFTSLETAAIGKFVPQFSTHVKGFLRRGFLNPRP
jgi:hypothetical protein